MLSGGLIVTTLLLAGVGRWLVTVISDLSAPIRGPLLERPADVLVLACAVAAAVIVSRWLLGLLVSAIALSPGSLGAVGRRVQRVLAPRILVRLTSATLGGAVLASLPAVGAGAAPSSPATPQTRVEAPAVVAAAPGTDGAPAPRATYLPDPSWRALATEPLARSADPDIADDGGTETDPVLVTPGDTLWDLAAHRLPGGSTTAAIDRAWRAWYAANRRVVGADPDLIRPGQRLVPPGREES